MRGVSDNKPPETTKRSGLSPLAQALLDVSKAVVYVVNEDGAAVYPAEVEGEADLTSQA